MTKYTLTTIFAFIISITLNAQNNNSACLNFEPFCLGTTYTADSGTPAASITDPGNNYNCLNTNPNPSWYYLKTSVAGQINMTLSAPADIDFIIYGPFTSYTDIQNSCGTLGFNSPIVDCSYSGTNVETASITSAAAGEYYILLITNYSLIIQEITLAQTSGSGQLDCSVFNQTGIQSITGNIFYDINQNGINDATDIPIPNFSYQVFPANFTGYSNYNGSINYNTQTVDTIDYTVSSSRIGWSATTTNPYQFSLDTTNNTMDTLSFGFYPDSVIQDVDFGITNNFTQCVANTLIWININNIGTDTVNGTYTFNIPPELEFVSSSQNYDSIVNSILYFSFDSLNLFETITFPIELQPITQGIINSGDTLIYSGQLDLYSSGAIFVSTYTDTIESIVICSYDPNIKLSFPNGNGSSEIIQPTDSLEYIIHFQNTGNSAAINITITDTLSSKLNLSSFKHLSSSHQPTISVDSNRVITFQFDNIMLPDSNSNELLSHGFIKFQVNLIDSLLPHDSITNSANIYFDYNPPIITNKALNIIDCYITPDNAIFSLLNDDLYSNLSNTNYTYTWILNNDTLTNDTLDNIQLNSNGSYELIVNEDGCTSNNTYFNCSFMETPYFTFSNDYINSNLNSTDYSFIWLLDGDTLMNEIDSILHPTSGGLFSLISTDVYGCQLTSDFDIPLSLKENTSMIKIFPTPSTSEFNVKSSNHKISSITIFDINGRIIEKINIINAFEYTIADELIQSGIYYIEITTSENQIITKKIMKL